MKRLLATMVLFGTMALQVAAQTDTLKVMAYNVLYYGSGCQGPNGRLHDYFKTIIGFTRPDIISLEKMASPKLTPDDTYGAAPYGFADSILKYALNAAFADKYAYCPFTNYARANNISILFYDKQRLGYVSMVCVYVNGTDFNTYKLYYKDPNLERTHDTTFLYLTLNHDKSGDEFEEVRTSQIGGTINALKAHFSHFPNYINLGDFNSRGADEGFYKLLTATKDTAFRVYDPPFFPDRKLKYPAHWDHEPQYSAYFTTSTRESAVVPNNCGSGGGGKNWYDHIFISQWLVNNSNYMRYIPNSYRTIGNDGQRLRVSIHNKNTHVNNSAPSDVIEAMYQFSNKYPVMIDLAVTPNSTGTSLPDPEIPKATTVYQEEVTVSPEFTDAITISFPAAMKDQEISVVCTSSDGTVCASKKFTLKKIVMEFGCKGDPGTYTVKISGKHNLILETQVLKQ